MESCGYRDVLAGHAASSILREIRGQVSRSTLADANENRDCASTSTPTSLKCLSSKREGCAPKTTLEYNSKRHIDFALLTFTAFFVIRAKCNLDYLRRWWRPIDKNTGLRSVQTIVLHGPKASKDYPDALRLIKRFVYSHQPLRPPSLDRAALQMPLGRWSCSSSGSSSTWDQGVLRHLREHGEDPDLDHHQHLRARRHR